MTQRVKLLVVEPINQCRIRIRERSSHQYPLGASRQVFRRLRPVKRRTSGIDYQINVPFTPGERLTGFELGYSDAWGLYRTLINHSNDLAWESLKDRLTNLAVTIDCYSHQAYIELAWEKFHCYNVFVWINLM